MDVDEVVKGEPKTYMVDGVAYKNFKELASAAGISYNAAIKRLHRGWSLEDIFLWPT